jgi:hypothetical protein
VKINNILTINDKLNKKIWSGPHGERINEKVSESLVDIAQDFFDGLKLEGVEIEDITFTGSLANYNFTKFSDIDLHLIVDFSKIDENYDLVREYFSAKTSNWNTKHKITIFGYEIEIYVQDLNEDHHSTGVFSLMNDEWIAQPNRIEPEIDEKMTKRKIKTFIDMIDRVQDTFVDRDYEKANDEAGKLIKKIKKFRQSGLEEEGEYSYENLTFKYLRNYDHIKTLFDIRDYSYDKMKSVEGDYKKKFKIFIQNDEIFDEGGFNRLNEIEKFQKRVKKRHKRMKRRLIGKGKQKPGSAYPKRPNYRRSKSSPPGFGGA